MGSSAIVPMYPIGAHHPRKTRAIEMVDDFDRGFDVFPDLERLHRTIQKSRLPGINPRYCPVIGHFSAPWTMDERLVSHQPGLLDSPERLH